MTLPDERTRAVFWARAFLLSLLDPKQTPKVPREIRLRARAVLKHYPRDLDLMQAVDTIPDVFGPVEHIQGTAEKKVKSRGTIF